MIVRTLNSLALFFVIAAAVAADGARAQGYADPSVQGEPREQSPSGDVTINADNAPIESVLKEIAHQAGLTPFYSSAVKNRQLRVTVQTRNASPKDAFDLALRGTGLVAVLTPNSVAFVESSTPVEPTVARGDITGTVIDARTQAPLRDAVVTLDGYRRRLFTDATGTFKLSGVEVGEHRITVRSIGYGRNVQSVTVASNRSATVKARLRPNPNTTLDQVFVTGVSSGSTPVELRRLPSAITVITSKELEVRGITHVDQLFHGDVPGIFAQIRGSDAARTGAVQMGVRGSTKVEGGSMREDLIKTYVDGVEMADPKWFNQIDPRSIERIEILTGPQATTIYGAAALNGVMQIYTKRGAGPGHRLTLALISGLIQNNVTTALTPQHDVSAQFSDGGGRLSYNVGGSILRIGQWTPAMQSTRTNWNAGTRMTFGKLSVDGTLRKTRLTNRDAGLGAYAADLRRNLYTTGFYPPNTWNFHGPWRYITTTDSRGLRLSMAPTSWWSVDVSAGVDDGNFREVQDRPAYRGVWDTLTTRGVAKTRLTTMRYNTAFSFPLTSHARVQTILGADKSKTLLKSTYGNNAEARPEVRHDYGSGAWYIQNQLGVGDHLFLIHGIRAEYDTIFGKQHNPNITGRYGMTYTRDFDTRFGPLTFKARGTYGRSTRPPPAGIKEGSFQTNNELIALYGRYYQVLPTKTIGPEYKKGGEAGLEMSLASHASFVLTRYSEIVDNLIHGIYRSDSVRSLQPLPSLWSWRDSKDSAGYGYMYQFRYVNAASIRNQGWELQGTGNIGPFTLAGTYTFQKSRVVGARPEYQQYLPWIRPGSIIGGGTTEHTWVVRTQYSTKTSSIALTLNGIGGLYHYDTPDLCGFRLVVGGNSGCLRMEDRRGIFTNGQFLVPPYILSHIDASHSFNSRIEGILQIRNAGNTYVNDRAQRIQVMGRQTNIGVRIRP